jgi:hypothetical protein
MKKTKIELIRKNGKGILGTIENAKHHAEAMLPYIRAMRPVVEGLGFETWRQGHNLHEFVTTDGRRFTLRPIVVDADANGPARYVGVRLSLRRGRSEEDRLYDIDSLAKVPRMLAMMEDLATPQIGRDSRLMNGCGSN